ncbi:MAG TPA: ABC transporter substrate-binding protein [Dongiaceae bacterium]|jgi:spermidine/putrescine transport system substrate-binding protein|nr:ABC transporter substrate-binding protein [Dongiaceae bacterium]
MKWRNKVGLMAGTLVGSGLLAIAAMAEDQLNYFTWSGYEVPDLQKSFEAQHPGALAATLFGDDDEAFTKVKAGFNPDLAHPCYDKLEHWKEAGLIEPMEISKIKNWDKIFPVFRDLPGMVDGGKTWMVPWDWGNVSITYRTDLIPDAEQSWKLLWDPKYKGKVATIDSVHDTPLVAGILAGVDPFNMDDAAIAKVKDVLVKQRDVVKMYTNDMTSVEQALASGELVAAMTWNASAVALKKQGVPVEYMDPKEGKMTWVCGYVMIKGTPHQDLAYDFINARLDKEPGQWLVENYGYGASSSESMKAVAPATLEELRLPGDPDTMLRKTIFIKTIHNSDKISKMFEEVKAGG